MDSQRAKDALKFVPDRIYIILYYFLKMGYFPNLETPETFNEKIQWMKLNYHNPLLTELVDKIGVRSYVAKAIGDTYLTHQLAIFDTVEAFRSFNDLPEKFVVKCSHDSQSTIICKDLSKFDMDSACKKLGQALSRNWFWQGREWAYKKCHPRILVEEYLEDNGKYSPDDYKFYCFNGKCLLIQYNYGRFDGEPCHYYTPTWEYLGDQTGALDSDRAVHQPQKLKEMIALSEKLSIGFPHVRVDWYLIGNRIVFGEMTFYTGGGFDPFYSNCRGRKDSLDLMLGREFHLEGFSYDKDEGKK